MTLVLTLLDLSPFFIFRISKITHFPPNTPFSFNYLTTLPSKTSWEFPKTHTRSMNNLTHVRYP